MRWWIAPTIVSTWLLVLGAAQTPWLNWENTAGSDPAPLAAWPEESAILRGEAARTVLMFVHPKCECTRNGLKLLEQVARLDFKTNQETNWLVVAWRPAGSNWKPETQLPVYFDEDGAETKRFGVTTSGHVFLFDKGGAVRFSGGLTDVRGSSEAGGGARLLDTSLRGKPAALLAPFAVFGCSFFARK